MAMRQAIGLTTLSLSFCYGEQGLGLGKVHGSKEAWDTCGQAKEMVRVEGEGIY